MHTFFHGWRRKAGVASLVMACGLSSAWLRSVTYQDTLTMSSSEDSQTLLVSSAQHLIIARVSGASASSTPFWMSRNLEGGHGWLFTAADNLKIYHGFHGQSFRFGTSVSSWASKPVSFTTLHFPYWSLAIPLTLLSAYPILWKPRKRAAAPIES
jgi:hypothetical protein